jgi:polyphosphate glucokinase
MNRAGLLFGVDVGGSGIKGGIVDPAAGELASDRYRIRTPKPSTPVAVAEIIGRIVGHFDWEGPIGVAIPGVVQHGVVSTAANIDDQWIGTNSEKLIHGITRQPVKALNDADAAGIAEMLYGVGRDETGLVILLTFGTGIGSAMFYKGELIPNTEFGHIEFTGMIAEHYAAARLVERDDMEISPWAERVGEYLRYLERVFTPDLFIFGGGISKRFDEIDDHLQVDTPVRVAELRNNAGIVGAALASRGLTDRPEGD